jgi:hypothetical protein
MRARRQRPPRLRRRVAGPRGNGDGPHGRAHAPPGEGDPGQRGPQVPLHVVGQGLEGADVEDPHRGPRGHRPRGRGRANKAVEAPEEGGERLAAARWGVHEDVAAAGDRRPTLHLRLRGRRERIAEPGGDGRRETRERVLDGRRRGGAGGSGRSAGHGSASIRRAVETDRLFYDNGRAGRRARGGPRQSDACTSWSRAGSMISSTSPISRHSSGPRNRSRPDQMKRRHHGASL